MSKSLVRLRATVVIVGLVAAGVLVGPSPAGAIGAAGQSAGSSEYSSGIGDSSCVKTVDDAPYSPGKQIEECDGRTVVDEPVAGPTSPAPTAEFRVAAGSAPVGSTNYRVPGDAIFVSPRGSDGARGTLDSPFATVGKAISAATSGRTIVLRAGSYHEAIVIPPNKRLTVQSYPDEAVWFDGSSVVDRWQRSGGGWSHTGWKTEFDSSPTYTFGASDGKDAGWSFVNPARPMAAHPDQVWIDGVAQRQVASAADVTPGTFFVDYGSDTILLGSDPTSKTVRASDLARAIAIRGEGSVLRGVGVRRFAPSVPHMGTVTAERAGITLENVEISDNSTTGLFLMGKGSSARNVTVERNGMLGASASTADDLLITGMLARSNNTEGFNNAPVSGGLKVARSRTVKVLDSVFADNRGPGLWFDESVHDGVAAGNDIVRNAGHGLIVEISAKFVLIDNLVMSNRDNGMKLNDASGLQVWNNTLVANGRPINIVQDNRRAKDLSTPGHDPRQQLPDPTMTWVTGDVTVSNNVISETTGNCLLCVEDFSREFSAEQMGVRVSGNIYSRSRAVTPTWLVVWSKGSLNPSTFTTLDGFRSTTGKESRGREFVGTPVIGEGGRTTPNVASAASSVAEPLPAALSYLTQGETGSRHLGAWFD